MPPEGFQEALAKYGSIDDIQRQHIIDGFFESGYMFHSHTSPYDLQAFFQKASLTAIAVTFVTYSSCRCYSPVLQWDLVVFLRHRVGASCPHGLSYLWSLLTGVSQAAECLWVESFAVLAGVYITPCLRRVRFDPLACNSAVNIKMSDFVLLTKRDGKPTILFRVISSNGLVHTGVQIKAHFFAGMKDE